MLNNYAVAVKKDNGRALCSRSGITSRTGSGDHRSREVHATSSKCDSANPCNSEAPTGGRLLAPLSLGSGWLARIAGGVQTARTTRTRLGPSRDVGMGRVAAVAGGSDRVRGARSPARSERSQPKATRDRTANPTIRPVRVITCLHLPAAPPAGVEPAGQSWRMKATRSAFS